NGSTDEMKSPDLFHTLLGAPQIPHSIPAASVSAVASVAGSAPGIHVKTGGSTLATLKRDYSQFGAGFGASAALLKAIGNLLGWADRQNPDHDPGKGALNNYEKAAIACNLAKFVGTVPLPAPGQPDAAYGLKVAGYGVALVQAIAQPFIRAFVPAKAVN